MSVNKDSRALVFVYGTLLKGESNHIDYYMAGSEFLGKATLSGFDMYYSGFYPAIVPGKGKVKGEVYSVTPESLKKIDGLEDEGNLYSRKTVKAVTDKGESLDVVAYIFLRDTEDMELVPESKQPYSSRWGARR